VADHNTSSCNVPIEYSSICDAMCLYNIRASAMLCACTIFEHLRCYVPVQYSSICDATCLYHIRAFAINFDATCLHNIRAFTINFDATCLYYIRASAINFDGDICIPQGLHPLTCLVVPRDHNEPIFFATMLYFRS
jgi:hypothetical protein